MAFKDLVNQSAYIVAVLVVVVLCAWSIVHTLTKRKDDPLFTEIHMSLSAISGTCLLLLILTWIHKSAK